MTIKSNLTSNNRLNNLLLKLFDILNEEFADQTRKTRICEVIKPYQDTQARRRQIRTIKEPILGSCG